MVREYSQLHMTQNPLTQKHPITQPFENSETRRTLVVRRNMSIRSADLTGQIMSDFAHDSAKKSYGSNSDCGNDYGAECFSRAERRNKMRFEIRGESCAPDNSEFRVFC